MGSSAKLSGLRVGFQAQRQALRAPHDVLCAFPASAQTLPPCGVPRGTPGQPALPAPLFSAQVTLSYGVFEGKLNVIKLEGPFSPEEDPSR